MLTPGWGTGTRGGSPPGVKLVPPLVYFWSLVNIKEQGEEISFCDPKPKWHKGGDMGFVGAHNDHQGRLGVNVG